MSVGPLSDEVTTVNVPVVGSAEFARGSYFMEWAISDMLANLEATIFVRKTVGELLFEGYEDDVMTIAADMNGGAGGYSDYSYGDHSYGADDFNFDQDEKEDRVKREVKETTARTQAGEEMKRDKFGWFYDVSTHYNYEIYNRTAMYLRSMCPSSESSPFLFLKLSPHHPTKYPEMECLSVRPAQNCLISLLQATDGA